MLPAAMSPERDMTSSVLTGGQIGFKAVTANIGMHWNGILRVTGLGPTKQ